jgi:hypothetical protein
MYPNRFRGGRRKVVLIFVHASHAQRPYPERSNVADIRFPEWCDQHFSISKVRWCMRPISIDPRVFDTLTQ